MRQPVTLMQMLLLSLLGFVLLAWFAGGLKFLVFRRRCAKAPVDLEKVTMIQALLLSLSQIVFPAFVTGALKSLIFRRHCAKIPIDLVDTFRIEIFDVFQDGGRFLVSTGSIQ